MNLNTFIFVPSDNTLSPLLLQNVEALSSIENGGWFYCFSAGSVVCPIIKKKCTLIGIEVFPNKAKVFLKII